MFSYICWLLAVRVGVRRWAVGEGHAVARRGPSRVAIRVPLLLVRVFPRSVQSYHGVQVRLVVRARLFLFHRDRPGS